VAVYLLSGGTTGLPKLIPRTHRDYVYNLKVSAQAAELDRGSVYLGALPVCHNFALGCPGVLGTLAFGGRAVLTRGRTIDGVLATMAAENVTISAAVPSLAHRWAARALARPDLASGLKLAVLQVGAARISAPQVADVTAALGCTVQQVYGMSEGLLAFTRHDDPPDVIAETQGRPASAGDQWRLVDDDGRDVPDGGSGELWVRGPYTVPGYFASAQVNEAAFSPEGWYGTGDIVRLHSSGNFIVAGRRRDFINRGGEKVSAAELEELIVTHPAVESAAAVAIPNEAFGEAICVFATVPGDDLELFELRRFLANHGVAAYKLPEQLEIVAELPVTAVGKVDKNALRKAAWRELGMSAHTDNSIVIEAPVEVVWEEVNRLEQWPVLFAEEYQRVDVLTTEADRVTFRITTKPQENGQSYSWVSERVLDREHHRVVARRLETGPFLYMHIVHSFEECPEGTRVRWVQDFEMKPRAPFTDTQMTSRINAGSEGNLRRHKQVIEEHWNGTTNG
jgi:acyl-CoA synthetase (AMP-forming)/AMP-acid ligase II